MVPIVKRWRPSNWASLKPFGVGEPHPNNYAEIWKALRENRDQLGYAWRILREGCCDGCSLGTTGMKDWTMPGVHLCNVRLRLLRLNTMPPFDAARVCEVAPLGRASSAELREMGRLPVPLLRRRGEPGFSPLSWERAIELVAARIRGSSPERLAFYLTSRGLANETYYAVQKAVRALGTNSIDSAARICHSPSTIGLKETLGVAATTCSYQDWLRTDLIVFIGSNVANNQPVAVKYLHYAKRAGTKVAVVNTYREPGMARYWVPSVVESALFGTRLADRFFLIDTGGDVAFLNGALKHMIERGLVDREFIDRHTAGFEAVASELAGESWEGLERACGASRSEMASLGDLLGQARRAVLVWSMGVTQHVSGEDAVRAIVNLGLSRGFVGREGCGLMPVRGHSGVQGGAEMGAYATVLPGGSAINPENARKLSQLWGFEVPSTRGLTAPEMIDAAQAGRLDLLFTVGGNFTEVLPDPELVRQALAKVPLRVHMDIMLSSQMLVDPAEEVLLLPATTRYETPGGVTETSTERRVIYSPEVKGPRVPEAREEGQVLCEIAARVRPDRADALRFDGTPAIRRDIARTIPYYQGIEKLARQGDEFQYGGPILCANFEFPTPDGKAHFQKVSPAAPDRPSGSFLLSTRRGKQFNSMVQEPRDALTRAGREAVFMNPEDAAALRLAEGDPVMLGSEDGRLRARVHLSPVKRGNLQVHWPEAQVLLSADAGHRGKRSGIPDYNAVVRVERLAAARDRGTAGRVSKPENGHPLPPQRPGEPRGPRPPAPPGDGGPQPPGAAG